MLVEVESIREFGVDDVMWLEQGSATAVPQRAPQRRRHRQRDEVTEA